MNRPPELWDDVWSDQAPVEGVRLTGEASKAHLHLVSCVMAAVPSDTRLIVDAGSGAGIASCLVARALPEAQLLGVDLSAAAAAAGTARAPREGLGNATFVAAALDDLPVAPGTADLVFSEGLLQYVPDESAALRTMADALRPGGRLVLALPNKANLVFRLTVALAGHDGHGSNRLYSRRSLSALARQAGLEVESFDGYMPAYSVQRLGAFYSRHARPISVAAVQLCRLLDALTGDAVSRRYGFVIVLVARKPR